ncbi:MAG: sugar ABC transporter substrate-binding protein [Candidatus Rokuibacteriota bacterium]|nr:MAG: sugar ABC transporter substrate-binding protein [Candidatus Rokubacteria bacterium]
MSPDRAGLLRSLATMAGGGGEALPSHPSWKFAFISHLTTNPLFVPLQYGIQDACSLVGCAYSWTGSPRGDTGEVVKAVQSAVAAKVGGIAVPVVDSKALQSPLRQAAAAGIPAVAYHVDAGFGQGTLPFVGQYAYGAGVHLGERIARLVRRGRLALFVADRGHPPVEARLKGTLAGIVKSGAPVHADVVLTTGDPYEAAARIDRYVTSHPRARGLFALELVGSDGIGRAVTKHSLDKRDVRAGAYGVLPATLELIKSGKLVFTLDEQPYYQGFLPALQLYLARISGGLIGPADVKLPLIFVTKANVAAYLAPTRYEGSSSKQRYPIV